MHRFLHNIHGSLPFYFFLALLRSGCAVDGEYGRGNRSQEAWVLYCGVSVTGGDVGLSGFAFI